MCRTADRQLSSTFCLLLRLRYSGDCVHSPEEMSLYKTKRVTVQRLEFMSVVLESRANDNPISASVFSFDSSEPPRRLVDNAFREHDFLDTCQTSRPVCVLFKCFVFCLGSLKAAHNGRNKYPTYAKPVVRIRIFASPLFRICDFQ